MPTVNKELKSFSLNDINRVSERFLMGWYDPKYDGHTYRIKGLNAYRSKYALQPLTKEWSQQYRVDYIRSHYSDEEIEQTITEYCADHDMEAARWTGIYLFDCRFGREYAKLFKELLGASKWRKISESTRVKKLTDTQIQRYGGVGVGGQATYQKMIVTKIDKNRALKQFASIGEEVAYDMLVNRFGAEDVLYQYGIHPYDERYPFSCDFYIKSLDLFIELNTHYSHADHWYDPSDKDDMLRVKNWNADFKKYRKAIHQFTETDVLKRKTAKNNKLNYLVFWDGKHRRNHDNRYDYDYMPVLSDFKVWYYDYNCDVAAFLEDYPENTY